MTLVEKIMAVYPELTWNDFINTIVLQDDGTGNPVIKKWGYTQPQPTQDQLAGVKSPALTLLETTVVDLVQKNLDDFAATRRYNGIMSACTYVNSNVPKFQIEGRYCLDVRDQTWAKCYQILNDVLNGVRPQPTVEEVLAELPVLAWPN